jgi:hypothetical protein
LKISLAAQDASIKIPVEQDNLENKSKQFLIRWAETALGFRLSKDESILYSDNSAILIGLNGHPRGSKKGFTLINIIVVIFLLATLMSDFWLSRSGQGVLIFRAKLPSGITIKYDKHQGYKFWKGLYSHS